MEVRVDDAEARAKRYYEKEKKKERQRYSLLNKQNRRKNLLGKRVVHKQQPGGSGWVVPFTNRPANS